LRDFARKPTATSMKLHYTSPRAASTSDSASTRLLEPMSIVSPCFPVWVLFTGFIDPAFQDVRFWPIGGFRKYLIFYRSVGDEGIEIIRVLHGARDVANVIARA
jgi:hypothetical protein